MTNRLLISAAALLAGSLAALAQISATEAFTTAPASVFPLLDTTTRMDMVDYYNSGMTTASSNNLGGQSTVTAITPSSLNVKMTDSSTAQVVVLPAGNSNVIAVISTVAAPGLDSSIAFFDGDWNPMATDKYFSKPSLDQWLTPEGKSAKADVEAQIPFMLASYNYDAPTGKLLIINNLNRFLDEDIYDIVSPYLRTSLSYTWDGKKFQLDR